MREHILEVQNVFLGAPSESREDAIRRVGQMLVDAGFARDEYIYGMMQREHAFSTAVESGVAMPHAAWQRYPILRGSHGEMRRCIWCSGSPRDWMTIWRSCRK